MLKSWLSAIAEPKLSQGLCFGLYLGRAEFSVIRRAVASTRSANSYISRDSQIAEELVWSGALAVRLPDVIMSSSDKTATTLSAVRRVNPVPSIRCFLVKAGVLSDNEGIEASAIIGGIRN